MPPGTAAAIGYTPRAASLRTCRVNGPVTPVRLAATTLRAPSFLSSHTSTTAVPSMTILWRWVVPFAGTLSRAQRCPNTPERHW